jgi:hypothetical protein
MTQPKRLLHSLPEISDMVALTFWIS